MVPSGATATWGCCGEAPAFPGLNSCRPSALNFGGDITKAIRTTIVTIICCPVFISWFLHLYPSCDSMAFLALTTNSLDSLPEFGDRPAKPVRMLFRPHHVLWQKS